MPWPSKTRTYASLLEDTPELVRQHKLCVCVCVCGDKKLQHMKLLQIATNYFLLIVRFPSPAANSKYSITTQSCWNDGNALRRRKKWGTEASHLRNASCCLLNRYCDTLCCFQLASFVRWWWRSPRPPTKWHVWRAQFQSHSIWIFFRPDNGTQHSRGKCSYACLCLLTPLIE